VSFAVRLQGRRRQISRTSNIVSDTPRPDIRASPHSASTNDVTATTRPQASTSTISPRPGAGRLTGANYNDANGTDVVHEAFDPALRTEHPLLAAGMNGGGADLGYMADWDGSDVAPGDGYAGNGESVLLTVGHVYAVRTGANRFGKIIVTTIVTAPDFTVTFNAAFQTKTGDPNYLCALGIHRWSRSIN
jgi:hypothetical protein